MKLSSPSRINVFLVTLYLLAGLTWCVKIPYKKVYSGLDDSDDLDEFVHDLAIKLKKEYADDLVSDLFATSYGLEKVARLSDLDKENRLFQFKFSDDRVSHQRERRKRSLRDIDSILDLIYQDDRVELVIPQRYLDRDKRDVNLDFVSEKELEDLLSELENEDRLGKTDVDVIDERLEDMYERVLDEAVKSKRRKLDYIFDDVIKKQLDKSQIGSLDLPEEISFNDEKYNQQWYLINEGQLSIPRFHDLNVRQAWINGYTGKNVVIVILDDGLDYEHPDFLGKYRADLSYNLNDENDTSHDPMPSTFDSQNNHGTRCAGAAVANANNSVCGVGIAYDAQIAAIKILDGPITDLLEARALNYKAPQVDIRSASWGPKDDGTRIEYPGHFVNMALEDGVKYGRNGKGTLYVWASGNGGENDDDCSCDGYVSHWNIISIGSINHRGLKPYFMETCPSTMAVVYSGGLTSKSGATDVDDPGVRVIASDVRGKCTSTFQGTSSAAPLAAGALALVLEANPELTYRDVMYLIARTSRIPNIEDTDGWIINAAKYHVNEKYGFGVLDVSQMIQEAQNWKNVGKRERCEIVYNKSMPIEVQADERLILEIEITDQCEQINSLEHVVANISFGFESRGDVKMTLISPHQTPSEILSYRRNDHSSKSVRHFPFMTVFNWGESPRGVWKLVIEPRTRKNSNRLNTGLLQHYSLVLFGTKLDDIDDGRKRFTRDENSRAYRATEEDVKKIYKDELNMYRQTRIINKRMFESKQKKSN